LGEIINFRAQASQERSSSPDEGVGEELDEAAPSEPEHKEPKSSKRNFASLSIL